MQLALKQADEQFIIARNEAMSESSWDVVDSIKRSYNRHNKYRLF
jgi:hypothetical protein